MLRTPLSLSLTDPNVAARSMVAGEPSRAAPPAPAVRSRRQLNLPQRAPVDQGTVSKERPRLSASRGKTPSSPASLAGERPPPRGLFSVAHRRVLLRCSASDLQRHTVLRLCVRSVSHSAARLSLSLSFTQLNFALSLSLSFTQLNFALCLSVSLSLSLSVCLSLFTCFLSRTFLTGLVGPREKKGRRPRFCRATAGDHAAAT